MLSRSSGGVGTAVEQVERERQDRERLKQQMEKERRGGGLGPRSEAEKTACPTLVDSLSERLLNPVTLLPCRCGRFTRGGALWVSEHTKKHGSGVHCFVGVA